MSDPLDNPRRNYDVAVRYAIDQVQLIRRMLARRGLDISGLDYLELGPGADLAPQLVLAGLGARVVVADKFLTPWDPSYHPLLYAAFLAAFPEPCPAIEAVLSAGSHEVAIQCLNVSAEHLVGVPDGSVDFVLSNAVLEHVADIAAVAKELSRVSRLGSLQAHQIDLRDHRDYSDPLAYLLMSNTEYEAHRIATNGRHGTRLRMPEIVELFSRRFWVEEVEINGVADPAYVAGVKSRLPADSPYLDWPVPSLVNVSGRIWLRRRRTPSFGHRTVVAFKELIGK